MAGPLTALRPSEFGRLALKALEAAEGQTRRRKRDQRPDQLGLAIKRGLLARLAEEDPPPHAFETWLMTQVFAAPAGGPVRAMAIQVLDEYRFSALDGGLNRWLREGAPSDDAAPGDDAVPAAPGRTPEVMGVARVGDWISGPACCPEEARFDAADDRGGRSGGLPEGGLAAISAEGRDVGRAGVA
jgi:hypothetical protein